MTQPTKPEPVAGTATPETDALDTAIALGLKRDPSISELPRAYSRMFEHARSLESQFTLAREKIAVQEKEIAEARNDLTGNLWSKWEIERAQTIVQLATARASLAAVTEKMEAIQAEVIKPGYVSALHHRIIAIITQEEGKPTL